MARAMVAVMRQQCAGRRKQQQRRQHAQQRAAAACSSSDERPSLIAHSFCRWQAERPGAKLAMFQVSRPCCCCRARNAASLGWVKLSPRAACLALQALSRCDGLAVRQAAESTPDQGRRLQSHDSRATSIATRSTYSSEQQWKHIPSHLTSYPTSRRTSRSRLLGAFGAYCRRGGLSKSSEQPTTASSVAPRIAR